MNQGDIYHVDLNPTVGSEQSGKRYVLLVSPLKFNQKTNTPIILPITQGGEYARTLGFTVSLSGAGTSTQGVIRCDQPRAIAIKARNGVKIESVPDYILVDALNKLATILDMP